ESLLRAGGVLGLVAGSKYAFVGSRKDGLAVLVARGLTIFRATTSGHRQDVPGDGVYSVVWAVRGSRGAQARCVADGIEATRITPILEPAGPTVGLPQQLRENSGQAISATWNPGIGLVLGAHQATVCVAHDSRIAQVLIPWDKAYSYSRPAMRDPHTMRDPHIAEVGDDPGERLARPPRWLTEEAGPSDTPEPRWWVIDSGRIAEAGAFTEYWEQKLARGNPDLARQPLPELAGSGGQWWRFFDTGEPEFDAENSLTEIICLPYWIRTSVRNNKFLSWAEASISERLAQGAELSTFQHIYVLTQSYADQAVLSSSLHFLWIMKYGLLHPILPNSCFYSPVLFQSFPRPKPTRNLADLGQALEELRQEILGREELRPEKPTQLRLSKAMNDPENHQWHVKKLRALHREIDQATLAAYGWSDLDPGYGFVTYRQVRRWMIDPKTRLEVLDRLLAENHRREAIETA
ncbi:MAG: hypothetical protein ACRC0L_07590, partial [Angustibacter sp.]